MNSDSKAFTSLESALYLLQELNIDVNLASTHHFLWKAILNGEYEKVIQNEKIQEICLNLLEGTLPELNSLSNEEQKLHSFLTLLAGIVSLCCFVQVNWTGPSLKPENELPSKIKSKLPENLINLESLNLNGENVYPKVKNLEFFYLAHLILFKHRSYLELCKSSKLWYLRCAFIHQQLLSNQVQLLNDIFSEDIPLILKELEEFKVLNEVKISFLIESGLILQYYNNFNQAKEYFLLAKETSGLQAELTGVLGMRTKFQTFQNAQLILKASSNQMIDNNHSGSSIPVEVENRDDTLLEKPKLVENIKSTKLSTIDQVILLSLVHHLKRTSPKDVLNNEELLAYILRIQENPNNWMVHSTCLLMKSRLEVENSRTIERGILQIQALVDQYSDVDSPVKERMKYIFTLPFPVQWVLKRELGEKYLSIGVAATALQIFESLEMWDNIITCYQLLNKKEQAEQIVRKRLEIEPSPQLWCVLGDLTNKEEYYEKSWEFSNHHYARAKRSLARLYLSQKQWAKSIENFEIALSINPLFASSWFSLGCALMNVSQFEKALNAFTRVVKLEPDEGDAWNNMATCLIQLSKKQQAFYALQEAIKYSRNNYRIWENYLYVCMDVGEFNQGIQAFQQILDMKNSIDEEILSMLCTVVTKNISDANGLPGVNLRPTLEKLLEYIASKYSSPMLWSVYATYYQNLGDLLKAIEYREKQCRALQTTGWEQEKVLFEDMAKAVIELAKLYLLEGSQKSIHAAQLKLKSILKKTEVYFSNEELYHKLESQLEELQTSK